MTVKNRLFIDFIFTVIRLTKIPLFCKYKSDFSRRVYFYRNKCADNYEQI